MATKKKSANQYFDRDAFLSHDDRETRDVEVPGGKLLIRQLDGEAVEAFVEKQGDKKAEQTALYRIISQSVIDPESGERIFDMKDVAALKKKSFSTLQKIQNEIMDLNELNQEAATEAKND